LTLNLLNYYIKESSENVNILNFILPPLMGGAIALFTNWLAIVMLFRPHREIRVFGKCLPFTPGLVPREQGRLAKKLAEAISTRLLTPEFLADELSDMSVWELPDMTVGQILEAMGVDGDLAAPLGGRMKEVVDSLLPKAAVILAEFPEKHPDIDEKLAEFTYKIVDENVSKFAGLFISKGKIYKSIKDGATSYFADEANHAEIREKLHAAIDALFTNENAQRIITEKIYAFHIKDGLSEILQKEKHAVQRVLAVFAGYLAEHLPIEAMVESKIAAFDVAEIEEIILAVAGRELKMIILLGGILGFMLGLLLVLF